MSGPGANDLLEGQDSGARTKIAQRVGELLSIGDLPVVERQAAESLARQLAQDAIDRVRIELATAVAGAPYLPRDLALRIAHDIDSVACPFLSVTDVFSEEDWEQLVLTLSRAALVSVAGRTSIPRRLALSLARYGDSIVVEPLVENPSTPMTRPVCDTIMDRFQSATWILDKLAGRDDLLVDVATELTTMVSAAAREKLAHRYGLPAQTDPLADDAETATLLRLIRETPPANIPALVKRLRRNGRLTLSLIALAPREGQLDFFAAALASLTRKSTDDVRNVVLHGTASELTALFHAAQIPASRRDEMWMAVLRGRKGPAGDT